MRVNCYCQGVVEHVGHQSVQQGAAGLETGVSVALYQPDSELTVDQKVQTEDFELLSGPSDHQTAGLEQDFRQVFHLSDRLSIKTLIIVLFFEVFVYLRIRHFVPRFVLSILIRVFLHSIVGEMYIFTHRLRRVLFATGPNVALTVPPHFTTGKKHPNSNIEFAAVVEERIDILLHNESPRRS